MDFKIFFQLKIRYTIDMWRIRVTVGVWRIKVHPFTTEYDYNLSYLQVESPLLGTKVLFKHQDMRTFGLKLNKHESFSPIWKCVSR